MRLPKKTIITILSALSLSAFSISHALAQQMSELFATVDRLDKQCLNERQIFQEIQQHYELKKQKVSLTYHMRTLLTEENDANEEMIAMMEEDLHPRVKLKREFETLLRDYPHLRDQKNVSTIAKLNKEIKEIQETLDKLLNNRKENQKTLSKYEADIEAIEKNPPQPLDWDVSLKRNSCLFSPIRMTVSPFTHLILLDGENQHTVMTGNIPKQVTDYASKHIYNRGQAEPDALIQYGRRLNIFSEPVSFYEAVFCDPAPRRCAAVNYLSNLSRDKIYVLNGTSQPLFDANADFRLRLDSDADALTYLRLFASAVRGEDGPFRVFSRWRELPWEQTISKSNMQRIYEIEREYRDKQDLKYIVKENSYEIKSLVNYGKTMSFSTFSVSHDGEVQMLSDLPLWNNVPVHKSYVDLVELEF